MMRGNSSRRSTVRRREFLVGAGAALAASRGRLARAAQSDTIVFCSWGGSTEQLLREGYAEPFTKKTGIRVVFTTPVNLAKAKAMVEANKVEWDILNHDHAFLYWGKAQNVLEPLDFNTISTKDVIQDAIHSHGLAISFGATVITYRTDVYPAGQGPKTWAEFWDVKRFPGRRALPKYPFGCWPVALAAEGVPRDKMYPMDVDRVFKSLDRIRPHVVKWWDTGAQAQQLITDKEVDLIAGWTTRMFVIQNQGVPIYVELNEGHPWGSTWGILKGAPNKVNAMKFLAFAIQHEEGMAHKSTRDYSGAANTRVMRLLEPRIAKWMITTPENRAKLLPFGSEWWAANQEMAEKLHAAWFVKG